MLNEADLISREFTAAYDSNADRNTTPNNNLFRLQITYKATSVSNWGFIATITTQSDIGELH